MFDIESEMKRINEVARMMHGVMPSAEQRAVKAQEALRDLVNWHQRNEDATLPSDLLAMLVAARRWA